MLKGNGVMYFSYNINWTSKKSAVTLSLIFAVFFLALQLANMK